MRYLLLSICLIVMLGCKDGQQRNPAVTQPYQTGDTLLLIYHKDRYNTYQTITNKRTGKTYNDSLKSLCEQRGWKYIEIPHGYKIKNKTK